ncbi:hypothetical protein DYB32_000430 [Aphanomyces invadans]|uniref:FYVE-type domain-containing protein n=1 Tax=Aphanomyces invadans TaxID=157072 RepID=A0A3R6WU12_9STRA|nr:hypothetical protein DYB32_000430 [Aphanomyces invadans]
MHSTDSEWTHSHEKRGVTVSEDRQKGGLFYSIRGVTSVQSSLDDVMDMMISTSTHEFRSMMKMLLKDMSLDSAVIYQRDQNDSESLSIKWFALKNKSPMATSQDFCVLEYAGVLSADYIGGDPSKMVGVCLYESIEQAECPSLFDVHTRRISRLLTTRENPTWVADHERSCCYLCLKTFTGIRRKHHCRACGEVICKKCSLNNSVDLPSIGLTTMRVCKSCSDGKMSGLPSSASFMTTSSSFDGTGIDDIVLKKSSSDGGSTGRNTSSFSGDQYALAVPSSGTVSAKDGVVPDSVGLAWLSQIAQRDPSKREIVERLIAGFGAAEAGAINSADIPLPDASNAPPEDIYDLLCDLASQALDCKFAVVHILDGNRQWFKSKVTIRESDIGRDFSFCEYPVRKKQAVVVLDTWRDPRFEMNPLVTGPLQVRFLAGAPLFDLDGRCVGAVCVLDSKPRTHLPQAQVALMEKLAHLAMVSMQERREALSKKLAASTEAEPGSHRWVARAAAGAAVAGAALGAYTVIFNDDNRRSLNAILSLGKVLTDIHGASDALDAASLQLDDQGMNSNCLDERASSILVAIAKEKMFRDSVVEHGGLAVLMDTCAHTSEPKLQERIVQTIAALANTKGADEVLADIDKSSYLLLQLTPSIVHRQPHDPRPVAIAPLDLLKLEAAFTRIREKYSCSTFNPEVTTEAVLDRLTKVITGSSSTDFIQNDDATTSHVFVTHGGLELVALTAIMSSSKAIKTQCARVVANVAVHHHNIQRQLQDVLGGDLFTQDILHWDDEPNVVVRSSYYRAAANFAAATASTVHRVMLDALQTARIGANGRPVVFITHSMGGLLVRATWMRPHILKTMSQVKEMLSQATGAGLDIARQTVGVVFLAVPHFGANLATLNNETLRNLVQAHPATKHLNENNSRLAQLNAAFEALQIPSLSLGEGAPAPLGLGVSHLVVKPESADPHIPLSTFHMIPHAHHMDICKPPTPTDPRYSLIRDFILQHVQHPQDAVE